MNVKQNVRPADSFAGIDISTPKSLVKDAPRPETELLRGTRRPLRELDMVELVRLYRTMEEGIGHKVGAIVQLVTPTGQEQCVETAYGLAWAGASLLGKRVLFIDAAGKSLSKLPASNAAVRIGAEPRIGTDISVQALADGTVSTKLKSGFFVASLPYDQTQGDVGYYPQVLTYLQELRPIFDLVVIATPPALDNALAAAISGFADGSILLLESGRSRYRNAARAIDVLSSGHAPFLGVILAKRVNPIPRWLRRWVRA